MKGQVHDEILQKVIENSFFLFHVPTLKGVIRIPLKEKIIIDFKLPYYTPNFFSQVTPPAAPATRMHQ